MASFPGRSSLSLIFCSFRLTFLCFCPLSGGERPVPCGFHPSDEKLALQQARCAIRGYIQHRTGKEGAKITRTLFGRDGAMGREEAYRMIDEAEKGSVFFRFVLSPDPTHEDTKQDLHLRTVTEQTMLRLEERLHKSVQWVAAVHDDHAPHRHVHVVAVVAGRLQGQDFQSLRQTATAACLEQRQERDLMREQQAREREEGQWERSI